MTNRPRLLADVAELRKVLRAMDEWETAGGDLDSAHGRRRFVDGLDDDATDELAGLALTDLARTVFEERMAFEEKATAREARGLGGDACPRTPDLGSWSRHGRSRVAA
jgi:hypothetical protein